MRRAAACSSALARLAIAGLLFAITPDAHAQKPDPAQAVPGDQAAPKLSEDQVRQKVHDALGAEVLGVRAVEAGGRPAYAVKVMNPAGNYNAAFLVTTLLVDGDTGEILGQMQRAPSPEDPGALPETRRPQGESGLELRRRTFQ